MRFNERIPSLLYSVFFIGVFLIALLLVLGIINRDQLVTLFRLVWLDLSAMVLYLLIFGRFIRPFRVNTLGMKLLGINRKEEDTWIQVISERSWVFKWYAIGTSVMILTVTAGTFFI